MTAIAGLAFRGDPPAPDAARRLGGALLAAIPGRGRDDAGGRILGPIMLAARAHRTLDLTPDGAQPYLSRAGNMMIVFDGYAANGAALRRELEEAGIRLTGHGDAELVAEATQHWGLNRLLQKLEGAFAFALWDQEKHALHLVRDRMGVKPLYVTTTNDGYAFASDPRAFKTLPGFEVSINHDAAACYLNWGYVAAPLCLIDSVVALPPAHRMMLKPDDKDLALPEAYWSAAGTLEESALRDIAFDGAKLDTLSKTLAREAARLDVPFALMDDATPPASLMRAHLDRASDKPYKQQTVTLPDGAALQTAFDALAQLPSPISDPMAPAWWQAFKRLNNEVGVCIAATGLARPAQENEQDARTRKILRMVPRFLRGLLPEKYAQLMRDPAAVWASNNTLWTGLCDAPDVLQPRIDANFDQRRAFLDFTNNFCGNSVPALDAIAASHQLELRLPMADARLLDYGLPCSTGANMADLAIWLRGPLRPRVQDLITPTNLARIGIDDSKPYVTAWLAFLDGDNTRGPRVWALASLLAWTKTNL